MKNKNIRMNNRKSFLESTSLIKKVLFLLLGICISLNINAQSITVGSIAATNTFTADGKAYVVVSGVPGGLNNYTWTNLSSGAQASFTSSTDFTDTLTDFSGTYEISVDNFDFGFSAVDTITITAPGATFSYNGSFVLCGGLTNAFITAFVQGCAVLGPTLGTNYLLTDASNNTILLDSIAPTTAMPLPPLVVGTYYLSSTNLDNGCVGFDTFDITAGLLNVSTFSTNVLNNTLGLFTITASGGSSPYTLDWQGQNLPTWNNGDTLIGLPAGTYFFTVSSSDGCTYSDSVIIQNTCDGQITSINYDPCAPEVFVSAAINMVGSGPFDFDYELSDGSSVVAFENSTASNITFSNSVGSGTFYLNITETNTGCIVTDTITHTLNPVFVSSSITDVTSVGACDGGVFVTPTSGQFPYTFEWSNSTGIISTTNGPFTQLTNLCDDTYCLVITDDNGCTFTECYDVLYYPCNVTLSIFDSINCYNGFGAIQVNIDTTGNPGGPYEYTLFNANNGNQIGNPQVNVNTQFTFPNLPTGNYFVNVFDPAFGSYCKPDTIILTEPDQINVWTTVDSSSAVCAEDGIITIDSITGGTNPFNITWLDSILSPLPTIADTNINGNVFQDSLLYSNENTNGYLILITDANGCSRNQTVYIHPQNSGADFAIESWEVTQPKCYGACDGGILATMAGMPNGCLSVPPFTFYWIDGATGGAGQVADTLKVDSVGTLFYNPSHVATYVNLCPGSYQLHAYDYYGNFGGIQNFDVFEPDSITIALSDSLELFCGEEQFVLSNVSGGPTVNDTTLISSNTLDFGIPSGFQDSLNINDYYLLVVSGTYEDTAGNLYDAAWDYTAFPGAPATPVMHWAFDGNFTHRPFPDAFNLDHTYTFPFVSQTGVHNFAMTQPGFLQPGATGMQFDLYLVRYDTTIFSYQWEYLNATGTANIGNTDSVLVYPYYGGQYEPTDYIVTVTDITGSCSKSDQIHVSWDLGILSFDTIGNSLVSCYGDSSSTIILAIDTTSSGTNTPGFAPYIFYLDGDSTLTSPSNYSDTIENVPAGTHTVSISDSLGCLSREISIDVIQSDSLYACGVDSNYIEVMVDNFNMTFDNPYLHTSVVPTLLGMNYRLKVSGTYNDSWSGSNYKDAAYIYNINPPTGNIDWMMNGSSLFYPTPNQYNSSHEYVFEFVGDGDSIDFTYNDYFDSLYVNNSGLLSFELYKMVCPNTDTAFTCFGDSTASSNVYPTGGTPFDPDGFANSGDEFYNIVWKDFSGSATNLAGDPWGTGQTVSNLPAGTYFAYITDALGCEYVRTLIVQESAVAMNIDTIYPTPVACRNDSSGCISAVVSGGFTDNIVVVISAGDTIYTDQGDLDTIQICGLVAGTYQFYIYDSPDASFADYDCAEFAEIIITQPQDILSTSVNLLSDVQCFGDSTGAAIANAIGGQFPYSYNWLAGNTSAIVNNLWPGWQVVEISDSNGCVKLDSIEIINLYPEISSVLDVIQDVSCFGGCDAIASLSTNGGVLPHTYFWDIGQVSINMPDTAFNLCYGGHDVIVEDALGCRQTVTYNISQPDELFAQAVMTQPIQCFGFDDGTAFASATGGTQFYSFVWDSINGQAGQNATNLTPGLHYVYVTDAKGCTAMDSVNISEPTQLTIAIDDTMTVYSYCAGTNSGQLCAIADGGTPNYNYVWNDVLGQTGTCATNLIASQYTVLVMDDRNCIATVSFNLDSITNSMDPDSVGISIDDVSCFGTFDGSVSITTVVGAVAPYTYSWTGPNSYSSVLSSISSLYAGSYGVVIEDSNGCAITVNAEVQQPDQLEYTTYNVESSTCLGACDGEIHVSIEGGTHPYFYDLDQQGTFPLMNTSPVINDTLITNLCAGLRSIYITDDNNCEGTVVWGGRWEETVDQGVVVELDSVVASPATCFNLNDGSAFIHGQGNPLFTYTWETNDIATNLPTGTVLGNGIAYNNFYPGTYWAVAHYADSSSFGVPYSGCDFGYQFTISSAAQLTTAATNVTEVTCYGDTDGEIDLIISGGTAPYSVQWDTTTSLPNGSSALQVNSLQPGTYTANIFDNNGCSITSDFEITEPLAITNYYTVTEPLCNGGSDGSAIANTNGGNAPYTYNPNISNNLSAGIYSVVVMDNKGCTFLDEVTITEPDAVISSVESDNLFFGPYDVRCFGENNASATVTGGGGVPVISYLWTPSNQSTATATNLSAGSYDVTVTDLNNCSQTETILITEPDQLVINLTRSGDNAPFYDISCFGLNDGWAQSLPIGGVEGTSGYNYQWDVSGSNISSNYYIDNLQAGLAYTITVVDVNGCEETESTPILTEPIEFIANVISDDYAGPTHEGFTVNFTDLTVCSDPYNFEWTWLNGTTTNPSGTTNFNHMFDIIGLNEVYVTLENEVTLCTDTVGFNIEVQGIPEIYNVFSPNGDGVNDLFGFGEYAMEAMQVEFFNRWGELVYSLDLSGQDWDGRGLDGRDLPEGVYFYVLQSTGLDGRYYEKRGSVTILR